MSYSITQFGEPLDPSKYTICEETRTFSSTENNLVLDFSGLDNWTFKTEFYCTFKTGSYCNFKTGSHCTFDTLWGCTFKTGYECVVVRRDIFEVIEIPEDTKIKLNGYNVKGYEIIPEKYTIKVKRS